MTCPERGRPIILAMLVLLLLPLLTIGNALAAGGPATRLVNVADTRAIQPGVSRWIADLYNTSLWQFSVVVVIVMALMGFVLGLVCDRLVGLLGIDLGKTQRHE